MGTLPFLLQWVLQALQQHDVLDLDTGLVELINEYAASDLLFAYDSQRSFLMDCL